MNFHKYGWLRTKWKWYSLQRKYECILWQNGSRWSTPIRHSTLTPIHLHTTCGFLRKMFYFKCKRTNADALSGARDGLTGIPVFSPKIRDGEHRTMRPTTSIYSLFKMPNCFSVHQRRMKSLTTHTCSLFVTINKIWIRDEKDWNTIWHSLVVIGGLTTCITLYAISSNRLLFFLLVVYSYKWNLPCDTFRRLDSKAGRRRQFWHIAFFMTAMHSMTCYRFSVFSFQFFFHSLSLFSLNLLLLRGFHSGIVFIKTPLSIFWPRFLYRQFVL